MSIEAKRRLLIDLKKMQQDPPIGTSAAPLDDDIFCWEAVIFGPEDTEWEGIFKLSLVFPQEYPSKPPSVKFKTRIFHPNVYNDGSICLDILQTEWSPVYDVCGVLTSIQSLLLDPNIESPANREAAVLYFKNRAEYSRRVRESVAKAIEQAENELGE